MTGYGCEREGIMQNDENCGLCTYVNGGTISEIGNIGQEQCYDRKFGALYSESRFLLVTQGRK